MQPQLHFFRLIIFSFFVIAGSLSKNSFAQSPFDNSELVVRLSESLTGSPDTIDYSASTLDASGQLLVAGNTTTANGTTDILLTKYTISGAIDWQVTYNNSYNNFDFATAVVVGDSDNVYVAGATTAALLTIQYVLLKYDSSGTFKWEAKYQASNSAFNVPTAMIFAAEGFTGQGYLYITGVTQGTTSLLNYTTVKFNKNTSATVWAQSYDYNSLRDVPAAITYLSAQRIIVSGASESNTNNWDFCTVQYDYNGNQGTVTRNPSDTLGFSHPADLATDQEKNIYITGTVSTGAGDDIQTVKLDSSLNTIWTITWDGSTKYDAGNSIKVDPAGFFYVAGYTSNGSGTEYITLKYDTSGNLIWERKYAAPDTTKFAQARMLDIDSHGNLVVTGSVYNIGNKDILTVAYDTSGNKLWEEWYTGSGKGDDVALSIKTDTNNIFYVTGKTWHSGKFDYVTIKYKEIDFINPPDTDYHPQSLAYYENKGQIIGTNDSSQGNIKFYSANHYPAVYFQQDTLSFVFAHIDTVISTTDTLNRVDLTFYNALSSKPYKTGNHVPGYLNYFLPQCSSGATGVRGFPQILYPNIYENIDLLYSTNTSGLKFYIICKPGSAPKGIIMEFTQPDLVNILSDSSLEIVSPIGSFSFQPPVAYQLDENDSLITLNWKPAYNHAGVYKVGLSYGDYDLTKPLIFGLYKGSGNSTPQITGDCNGDDNKIWSTYFGGTENDLANDVTSDEEGNVYMVGSTNSDAYLFPVTQYAFQPDLSGSYDAFIAKFDNNFSQDGGWCTYYGGSRSDNPRGIAVYKPYGSDTRIFVTGYTTSDDIDVHDYFGYGTAVQEGYSGPNFAINGFMLDLNQYGLSQWFTYFGDIGTQAWRVCTGGIDPNVQKRTMYVCGIAEDDLTTVDPGNSFVQTSSNGSKDGFVASFTIDGEQLWTTYFGSDGEDELFDIAYDPSSEHIYAVGYTTPSSISFQCTPTNGPLAVCTNGAFASYVDTSNPQEGLIVCFSSSSNSLYTLVWSTPIGGDGSDVLTGVTTTNEGQVAMVGISNSEFVSQAQFCNSLWNPNFLGIPIWQNCYQSFVWWSNLGVLHFYICKFEADGCLAFASFYGSQDSNEGIGSLRPDITSANNLLYITGVSGTSNEYPTNQFGNTYLDDDSYTDGYDEVITCFDPCENVLWGTYLGGEDAEIDEGTAIYFNPTTSILFTAGIFSTTDIDLEEVPLGYNSPYASDNLGEYDAFIAAFCIPTNYTAVNEIQEQRESFNVFPNPASSEISLSWSDDQSFNKIIIRNAVGQIQRTIIISPYQTEFNVIIDDLASGIFSIQAIGEKFSAAKTLIHIK